MKRFLPSVLLLLASFAASAQNAPVAKMANAIPIGPEGITITAISNPSALLQFGTGTTWCPAANYSHSLWLVVSYLAPNLPLCPFDPAPGLVKEIDAQQAAAAYTVTFTHAGTTTLVTVPALTATPPVTTPPGTTPAGPVTITLPSITSLPLGCASGVVSGTAADGSAAAQYFYILCAAQ
jgi:hypothetical protein